MSVSMLLDDYAQWLPYRTEVQQLCPGVAKQPRNIALWSRMLTDALSTERPGKESEAYVKKRFSLEVVTSKAITLYREILNDKN